MMSALFLNAQETELLSCFNSFDVRYLVIGHAVQFHGHLRPAKDLDIFIDRSDSNPVRVVSALRSLGFVGSELSANLFSEMKKQIPLGQYQTEAYARRVMANENGIAVPVISYDDLLQQKRMLGRPQDIADVEALENGKTAG